MVYERPSSMAYPRTWHRFSGRRPRSDGLVPQLQVQDLTEDMEEEAVQMLLEHFVNDEPPCKHIEVRKHPKALAELENLWRRTLKDRLSLVCVEDGPGKPRIVGLNVLTVALKEDKDEPFVSEDPIWSMLFGAVELVANSVDVFDKYGVDKYLTAYGLVVDPEYRGQGVGVELLKGRIPLCKALGIQVTATVFTAIASQIVAKKAGFHQLSSISYADMALNHGIVFPGVTESTKSSLLMALVVE